MGFRAASTLTIEAPIGDVWQAMLDVREYRTWNPFIVAVELVDESGRVRADGVVEVGATMKLDVRFSPSGGAKATEQTTVLEPPGGEPLRARWVYRYLAPIVTLGLLRCDRFQELEALGPARTRYSTHEEFEGVLSRFVPLKKVQDGFDRQAAALKRRVER